MDTKSKNIKYSYGTKVIAFFIAIALVISSGVLIASSVDMMLQYSPSSILNIFTQKTFNYTDSMSFESQLSNDMQSLKTMISQGDYKEFVSGKYCTLDEELEKAGYYYDSSIASSQQEQSSTDYTYVETFEYDMKISSSVSCGFANDTSKSTFLDNVKNLYNNEIENAKRSCENEHITAIQEINSFVNLKYLITNHATDEVYTNTTKEEIDANKDGWYMVYTAKGGIIESSDNTDNVYFGKAYDSSNTLNSYFGNDGYDITLSLPKAERLEEGDRYYSLSKECAGVTNYTTQYMISAGIMLLAAFALAVYLVMVSGRTNLSDAPQISWVDKIPTDIHFCISWGLVIVTVTGAFAMIDELVTSISSGYYDKTISYAMILVESLLFGLFCALIIEWAMHISRYYKSKRPYIRNSLLGIIIIAFVKFCKEIIGAIKHVIGFAPKKLKKRSFYIVLLYILANIICACILAGTFNNAGSFFFTMLFFGFVNIVMLTLMWKYIVALDGIIVAAEDGKNGEGAEKIDSEKFPEPLKSLADNLYITQDEMKKAVDEAVKGERMKTELITNVSHDLKTPLTSIISYVDLLKKCDIDDIQAQQYINVLDEKSIRLKRLIEDLVEASKVSSGAVSLNKMNVSLDELTVQAIAEVEDGFSEKGLEIVYNKGDDLPIVFADSQKTWRVIDNLLSNARKYSLNGSRIYVEVFPEGDYGCFSIKNVSKVALNINSEELTQRFVRGDAARTNEGSGLGLSIAKDLCSLQGGELHIDIDGDLFKATIKLPLANQPVAEMQPEAETQPE